MRINFRKGATVVVALVALGLSMNACTTTQSARIKADSTILRVGVSPTTPPMIYKQNDEIIGVEADLAKALANDLQRKAILVEIKWADQIPALLENRIDIIMSSMSVTPERQYDIAFSKPYFNSGLMMLTKNLQKFPFITNVEAALAQSITWRIGVIKGTTGEAFVAQRNIGAKAIKSYKTQDDALKELISDRIDVFVHDAPMILMMAAKHKSDGVKPLPFMLNEEYLAWGLRKSDADLITKVNAFIDKSKADGTLRETIERWIPMAQ